MNKLNKLKDWAAHHKGWAITGGIAIILLIIMLVVAIMLFMGSSSNKYGHRLDGIKEVEISKDTKKEVEAFSNEKVESTKMRVQGRIIYIDINFVNDITKEKAKEIAKETLSSFSEEELKYYDVCYFLIQGPKEGSEDATFVITGTKHPSIDEISWIKE